MEKWRVNNVIEPNLISSFFYVYLTYIMLTTVTVYGKKSPVYDKYIGIHFVCSRSALRELVENT